MGLTTCDRRGGDWLTEDHEPVAYDSDSECPVCKALSAVSDLKEQVIGLEYDLWSTEARLDEFLEEKPSENAKA